MRDFRGLDVWQIAHRITLSVYHLTRCFPCEETYEITSQLRRCSFSVAANIAEGCGRSGTAEFGRFLSMAMGSASELKYFLLLARDLECSTTLGTDPSVRSKFLGRDDKIREGRFEDNVPLPHCIGLG